VIDVIRHLQRPRHQGYLRLLVVAAAALWMAPAALAADGVDDGVSLHRGIAISHTLAWAPLLPAPARGYDLDAFAERAESLREGELSSLRRSGFDFVRLAVDPGPFLEAKGSASETLYRVLERSVRRILAANLSVIVDFHPGDQKEDETVRAIAAGVQTPKFQAYLALLARTARLLDGIRPRRVALEVMNEPPLAVSAWQPMLDAAYTAVRREAADLPLVLDGGLEGGPQGMMELQTSRFANDPAAIFTFHDYDPYQFTHQGAPWNAARHLADVPYPALARPIEDSIRASARLVDAMNLSMTQSLAAKLDAQVRLQAYRRSQFGRDDVMRLFDEIGRWAQERQIPPQRILLGEFGARRTAQQDDAGHAAERAQWFRDVRTAAELHQFPWAVWTYRGPDFGLFGDEIPSEPEPAVSAALGLDIARRGASAASDRLEHGKQIQGMRP
jgi:endoglucanase